MFIIGLFYFLDAFAALRMLPIFIMYCAKPNKSLREGFRDWLDESNDI